MLQAVAHVFGLHVERPGAKLVLLSLANHYNAKFKFSWPSQLLMAQETSMGERAIRDNINWLIEKGFVARTRRRGKDGKSLTDAFDLLCLKMPPADFAGGEPSSAGNERPKPPAEFAGNPVKEEPLKKDTPLPLKGGDGVCEKSQDIFACKEAFDYYNEKAKIAGVPIAMTMGKTRKVHLTSTLRRIGGLEVWKQMVDKAMTIPGLTGGADGGWRIDFDGLLQEKTSTRILEGFYDRWGQSAQSAPQPMSARERKYYEENLKKLREGQGASQ